MEEIKRKILKNKFSRVILEWDRRIEQNAYRYNFEEFTLSSGLPGVILLLLEMEDLDRAYKFKIDQYCDYLYGKLSKYGLLTGSLYSGAAGIALSLLPQLLCRQRNWRV